MLVGRKDKGHDTSFVKSPSITNCLGHCARGENNLMTAAGEKFKEKLSSWEGSKGTRLRNILSLQL